VTFRERMLSRVFIRTWLLGIVLASGPSTYVPCLQLWSLLIFPKIIRVVEIEKTEDVRRPYIKQLLTPNLKFPLPHRIVKARSTFVAKRPSTF
jgi:hypothetical protein